jgi:4-carboxymuconolactone decarboxylase
MSRYTPVTNKAEMEPGYEHVFDQVMGVFGRVRGPFSMLLHSPKLTERFLPMVPFAREICVVDPKLRQIAILTAVRERDANYVWAAQVDVARRLAKDFENLNRTALAFIRLASIRLMLRKLSNSK